jgi:hypothetical protein
VDHYGILLFLLGVAAVTFAVGWDREVETASYVGHTMVGLAAVLALFMGMGYGPAALSVAAVAVFLVNFGVLVKRIRHS